MKKLFFIPLLFLLFALVLNSCTSSKKTTSGNDHLPKTNNKSQFDTSMSVSGVKLNEGELKKIKYFAEKMAQVYCDKKEIDQKYAESGGNEEMLNHINELDKSFKDYEKQVSLYFTTDMQKQEFNRIYYSLIQKCN